MMLFLNVVHPSVPKIKRIIYKRSKYRKANKRQVKIIIATCVTWGLAEGIIDGTHVLCFPLFFDIFNGALKNK